MAGQVLNLADSQAAKIAQQAQNEAAALREAAEGEAAAIREAASRDAAEMRARLDSMLTELSRVAAYLTETYDIPALPITAPAISAGLPDLAGPAPVPSADTTKSPDGGPEVGPGTRPARPRTALAGPRTATRAPAKPTGKPITKQQRQGRQRRAMRFALYGTAAAVILALTAGAAEIGQHGYGFFVFRENGQGDTPNVQPGRAGDNRLDTDFLAQQAKAAQQAKSRQALKGRHHKTPPSAHSRTTATTTTGG
jgi:hypothetical protein